MQSEQREHDVRRTIRSKIERTTKRKIIGCEWPRMQYAILGLVILRTRNVFRMHPKKESALKKTIQKSKTVDFLHCMKIFGSRMRCVPKKLKFGHCGRE